METITADIADLVPDPQNPRVHPKENIAAIKESLKRFGQVLPVLVRDSDCQIVAGNGTVEAMKALGWTQCQVAIYDGSDAECRALSVALNRTGELAIWDDENLAKVIGELQGAGFDNMKSLGFDSQALDDFARIYEGEAAIVGSVDAQAEWQGMPEYAHEDKNGHRTLVVHFVDQAAVDRFVELLGVHLPDSVRYMWYPEQAPEKAVDKRCESES